MLIPNVEKDDPMRQKERQLITEPRVKMSNTESELPQRAIPKTDTLLPNLPHVRMLYVEPNCNQSKTDTQLPNPPVPHMDNELPSRHSERKLNALPKLT
jgi:hypothetical protein